MPGQNQIIELLCTLAEEERLRVTVKSALKGGLIVGLSATAASVLLGPFGFVVGGTIGGLIASLQSQGSFLPVAQVIATMDDDHRQSLSNNIQKIMNNIDVNDIACFGSLIAGDLVLRRRVLETLGDYLKDELSMALVS